jgi:hypothetical protein
LSSLINISVVQLLSIVASDVEYGGGGDFKIWDSVGAVGGGTPFELGKNGFETELQFP